MSSIQIDVYIVMYPMSGESNKLKLKKKLKGTSCNWIKNKRNTLPTKNDK